MSSYKSISREHNAALVNKAAALDRVSPPRQGWIKAVRIALGMSGATLSQRLDGHRSTAAYLERSEQDGTLTLNKLREAAAAMQCELVYSLVPKGLKDNNQPTAEDLLFEQADRKAQEIVKRANVQMALEAQQLNAANQQKEIDRLRHKLLDTLPKTLWQKD